MPRRGVQPRFIPTLLLPTPIPLPATSSDPFALPTDLSVTSDLVSSTSIAATSSSLTDSTLSTSLVIGSASSSLTLIEPLPGSSTSDGVSSTNGPSIYSPQLSTSLVISTSSILNLTAGTSTPLPLPPIPPPPPAVNRSHLSPGATAAAVIFPTAAAIAIFALIFICLRRRKRAVTNQTGLPVTNTAEKKSSWLSGSFKLASVAPVAPVPPIITSSQNNAYNTGLDTSDYGSQSVGATSDDYYRGGGSSDMTEPPPPYVANKPRDSPPRAKRNTTSSTIAPQIPPMMTIPALLEPSPQTPDSPTLPRENDEIVRSPSPFDDPPHHRTHDATVFLPTPPTAQGSASRPGTSRSETAQSFTSTLYSDSASVHSARAERVSTAISTGDSHLGTMHFISNHQRGASDPFADARERNSPVSPIEDESPRRWSRT
ncbi:Hypothetical protein R9X50_00422800 [Acrodontium crateriforme]|uniref:Uncharacterized protein n=1 Tax=Acrodontium crateriforme TaxID=150365 RepID=A0AAQ3M512_9PEZI|nr:Hypothetical protein R9X50_00422800 [Acrodontium crateriforme]